MGCAGAYLFILSPSGQTGPAVAAAAQEPSATPVPSPISSPSPTGTATPMMPAQPTSRPTLVVTLTVQPTPKPTLANCVEDVTNFDASAVISNEEVKRYLRETIPLSHLDGCRGIEYFHQPGSIHGTPIAGSIVPIYREIQVFAVDIQYQTAEQILDTVTHEIGHNVHKNIRANNFDLDIQWAALHAQSQESYRNDGLGFVSDYARSNKFEDFAESYRTYVRDPEILIFYNVAKYDFMRIEVFTGLEYER
jgi:hypothetical protein